MLRLPPPFSPLLRRLSSLTRAFSSATDARDAYRRKMLGRPPTVKLRGLDWKKNSCSFIGTVLYPVKQRFIGCTNTVLEVNPSGKHFSYPFRILLDMRDTIAEISLQYLKPDDFVYVLGVLKSFEKVDENGDTQVYYKVFVTVLKYVKRRAFDPRALDQEIETSSSEPNHGLDPRALDQERAATSSSEPNHGLDPRALDQERAATSSSEPDDEMDRLYLWGVYFANPCEWWDNRKRKEYPGDPDFKHEDTGECLWIMPDDPPWIQKQLHKNDSNLVTGYQRQLPDASSEV